MSSQRAIAHLKLMKFKLHDHSKNTVLNVKRLKKSARTV